MAIKQKNRYFYSKDWRKISEEIITKRGEECELCKKKRDNVLRYKSWLTVHHKDRNPANNEESNLIVVCPKCHFHLEYLINRGYFNEYQLTFDFYKCMSINS